MITKSQKNFKTCMVCKREFECYGKPYTSRGRQTRLKRPYNSLTCSKECSKKYTLLKRRVAWKNRKKVKKNKVENKNERRDKKK